MPPREARPASARRLRLFKGGSAFTTTSLRGLLRASLALRRRACRTGGLEAFFVDRFDAFAAHGRIKLPTDTIKPRDPRLLRGPGVVFGREEFTSSVWMMKLPAQ